MWDLFSFKDAGQVAPTLKLMMLLMMMMTGGPRLPRKKPKRKDSGRKIPVQGFSQASLKASHTRLYVFNNLSVRPEAYCPEECVCVCVSWSVDKQFQLHSHELQEPSVMSEPRPQKY